jgi:hypothetical protein
MCKELETMLVGIKTMLEALGWAGVWNDGTTNVWEMGSLSYIVRR